MVILSGEVDLMLPDDCTSGHIKRRRMKAGAFVYYPAGFAHTRETAGLLPANYMMLKWSGRRQVAATPLAFQDNSTITPFFSGKTCEGFSSAVIFEGPTVYLSKLHSHLSIISPGCGYDAHQDDHDVVLVMLAGSVETSGHRVKPHDIIYYAAGEPHGMNNPGTVPVRYLVLEFHGLKARERAVDSGFSWLHLLGLNKIRQWFNKASP